MKLIFLHGPPAVGKYTIGSELAARIGCGVFHNHLTIDAARPIFAFGSSDFWKLVHELRLTCLRAAAARGTGVLVLTSCYDHPHDLDFYEEIEAIMSSAGAELIPIYLSCAVSELERRVVDDSRIGMRKVSSVAGLRRSLAQWNCVAVPRSHCVTVVTDGKTPAQCAEEIIVSLQLLADVDGAAGG